MRVILFVAVLSSAVSVPLAMLADWLMVHILAAPTAYGPLELLGSPTHRVQSPNEMMSSGPSLLPSHQQRNDVLKIQPMIEGNEKALSNSLWDSQSVWREMDSSLQRYRSLLSVKDRQQFDEQWGLQEDGRYLPVETKRSWTDWFSNQGNILSGRSSQKSVADLIRADIERVMSMAARENAEFRKDSLSISDAERNKRVLFHFQADLLVGLNEETLEAQDRREYLLLQPRHVWTKRMVWMLLVTMNTGMLFYLFLFGVSQDAPRQRAWVQSFALWLLMEIVFYSSLVALISHVLVPSLLLRNVAEMRRKMVTSLMRCQQEFQLNRNSSFQYKTSRARSSQNTRIHTHEEDFSFNAASFLFVSHRLAQSNPDLRASQLVLAYHTPWPRESYRRQSFHNDTNTGTVMTIAQATDAFIALCVLLLSTFLKLPNQSQDIFLRMFLTLSLAYVGSWHMTLYDIHPVLVIVPSCVCAVIFHFVYLLFKQGNEKELAKVAPAPGECDDNKDNTVVAAETTEEKNDEDEDLWSLSSFSDLNSASSGSERVEAKQRQIFRTHLNRRQSIQQGLRMLELQGSISSMSDVNDSEKSSSSDMESTPSSTFQDEAASDSTFS